MNKQYLIISLKKEILVSCFLMSLFLLEMCIRDRPCCGWEVAWILAIISFLFACLAVISETGVESSEAGVESVFTFAAVSYTHLDVYKRQAYTCTQRGAINPLPDSKK